MKLKWFKKKLDKKKIESLETICPKKNEVKTGIFGKLKNGLLKSREFLSENIDYLFRNKDYIDDEILDGLEELLITSDVGINTTMKIIDSVISNKSLILSPEDLKEFLKKEILKYFNFGNSLFEFEDKFIVCMIVGVNGVGKTTTVVKLANREKNNNKKVLIGAADTFRAGALEQILVSAKKIDVDVIKGSFNADPAAVAYDTVSAGISRRIDRVFIDTAGRFHTKKNLMEELKKIKRSIAKKFPSAPHEIFLVLDGTTGQNAFNQVNEFNEFLDLTGIIVTKLDGTAKGGIIINIAEKFNIPIRYIGVGESLENLVKFNSKKFVNNLL